LTPLIFEEEKHLLGFTIVGDHNDIAQKAFADLLHGLFHWSLDLALQTKGLTTWTLQNIQGFLSFRSTVSHVPSTKCFGWFTTMLPNEGRTTMSRQHWSYSCRLRCRDSRASGDGASGSTHKCNCHFSTDFLMAAQTRIQSEYDVQYDISCMTSYVIKMTAVA
jgi:hypothetical protein